MAPEYAFFTRWRVRGTTKEVADVLGDVLSLPRWWPSVYLDVKELAPGDPVTGTGRAIELYTKGWLPYTLRWRFTVTESDPPNGFKLVAEGDFVGTGVWTFKQDGDFVEALYDWRIGVDKTLIRLGTPIFRPVFAANHRWAMARGEQSLVLELRRRHATTPAERKAIPPPPKPTFKW